MPLRVEVGQVRHDCGMTYLVLRKDFDWWDCLILEGTRDFPVGYVATWSEKTIERDEALA